MRLSFTARRAITGVAAVQFALFVLNYYRFHLLDSYDKKALVISSVILGVCVLYIGPTVEEARRYRAGPGRWRE